MKERPILFSAEMVRAILSGAKTQTRRVIKPLPPHRANFLGDGRWCNGDHPKHHHCEEHAYEIPCPHGQPGDRLWVRETFAVDGRYGDTPPSQVHDDAAVFYKADGHVRCDVTNSIVQGRWRSPRFMPRWASRIDLEITGVRVERVQGISEKDADAEGVKLDIRGLLAADGHATRKETSFKGEFQRLWDSINAKRGYSWESNPWVWVLEFKRVTP